MSKEKFTALLGAGSEYSGTLKFEGTVHINGKFTGDIVSEGKLILFQEADVHGTVTVGELVVNGKLNAEVTVAKTAFLHSTARVRGTLTTSRLAMEEGAVLHGILNMIQEKNTLALCAEPERTDARDEPHIKQ